MIRNLDLDSFVCCAVCSKITPPPPPSSTTFGWILEYKPFRTQYCTHCNILEIGADIQQEPHEKKEAEIPEHIEKMKAELCCCHYLRLLLTLLKEEVRKVKAEMQQYMEDEQKREAEAAKQCMAHRLQCVLMECAQEKMQVVVEARKQQRKAALKEAARQHSKVEEAITEGRIFFLCIEVFGSVTLQLNNEKCHDLNIALSIIQKENQIETEKELKKAETLYLDELEKVMVTLKTAEQQVKTLMQKLEKMTDWKGSLVTEIQATRQAFQKYIDATFPNLSPGQADFILPFRKPWVNRTTNAGE
uniref:Chromosome 6 open reading frame 163 n=1 Tax=Otus sunia TaxID=257818 RepID=A0A8C8B3A7_9STRI